MTQLSLDDLTRKHPLWDELDEWIRVNPRVWNAMVDRARLLAAGGHKFGANALLYWARIEFFIRYTDGAQFALNNNFAPVVARRLIADYPELADALQTRYSRVDWAEGLTPYSERRAG